MKFERPESYIWLCEACRGMLAKVTELFESGEMPDTDDNEAPCMYMGDHQLFCGGGHCNRHRDEQKEGTR
jgi:hypothetical protein